jgi:predicted transcriptional regulator
MKRRERKWTKRKLLKEPRKHPILSLWERPEVQKITNKRGEKGLHFNDMRYLLCRDFKLIKRPPKEWKVFSDKELKAMREYNDYTILQKDLTKLCDIGFLRKESRGYYSRVGRPVIKYIQDFSSSGRNLIGSTENCDIVATDDIELTEDVEKQCEDLFKNIMDSKALTFESKILDFWDKVDSSRLDIQQKILLRSDLYPFTRNEILKKLIKKECLITTKRGKESFDISPFRKRKAAKLKKFINITKKHSKSLGNYDVKYAMGMYSYPNIFTEDYITKKGKDFKGELEPYIRQLQTILLEFEKPCYVLLAPRR